MRAYDAAGKETGGSHQAGPLQGGESHDAVTGGAAPGIPGPKPHQEASAHGEEQPPEGPQGMPAKKTRRQKTADLLHTQMAQIPDRAGGDGDRRWIPPQISCEKATDQNAGYEIEVPGMLFPVIAEKRNPRRHAGRADIPERGRHPQAFIAEDQECRHGQPDERASHIPGPGFE